MTRARHAAVTPVSLDPELRHEAGNHAKEAHAVVKTGAHQVVETVGPPWRPGAVYGDDEIAFCRADADAEAVGRLLGEAGIGRVVEVGDAGSRLRSGLFAGPGENG